MLRTIIGNIWDYYPKAWVVIPTNIGWTRAGHNTMGRGLARDAAKKYPDIPILLGYGYRTGWHKLISSDLHRMIFFPVKPLAIQPHLSWKQSASLALIEKSTIELSEFNQEGDVVVPLVGCGNGRLHPEDVIPILKTYLTSPKFTLVLPIKPSRNG